MQTRLGRVVGVAGIAAGLMALVSAGWGDCGSVPFTAAITTPIDFIDLSGPTDGKAARTISIDPLKVTVFEPKQRAIILWNGAEEILFLSTDQRASQRSAVLEVIPLPSEPTVRLGSFKTFEAAQRLVVNQRMWAFAHGGARAGAAALPESAGRITFQQKLGAHNLAVAEALDSARFVQFVQDFLQKNYGTREAPIRPEFVEVIQSYLNEGFRWFAFDVIELDTATQSREPIEYRFRSGGVYYPLRISSLEGGKTNVEHLVFTPNPLGSVSGPVKQLKREPTITVKREEVEALDEQWKGFFGPPAASIVLNQWSIEGESAKLLTDVRAK
jgi:hypothetical protein